MVPRSQDISVPAELVNKKERMQLPIDFPAYLVIHRLLRDVAENGARKSRAGASLSKSVRYLRGWTAVIECFTFRTDVFIKLDRDAKTLAIFVKEDDGKTVKIWEKSK